MTGKTRLAAAFAACALVAGCGGGTGGGSSDSSGGSPASGQGDVREGGSVTAGFTAQPDYLDPALSYSVAGREAVWLAYTPLLTYKHAEGAEGGELIPGLADGQPKVGDGGKTYTLTLRKGLKYSDGSAVKASDVEHAIKRVFILGSGGAPFFEVIKGAKEYESGKKPSADISGITTDDATGEIKFELTQPRGDFGYILAFPFAAPVPASTPFKDQSSSPPPGVGSYTIGDVTPNRQFVMTRNKDFDLPDIPKGHLDTITVKIVPNLRQQTQQVLANQLDYMDDPPPADLLGEVKAKAKDRFKTQDALSTYFLFLNTREKPFDNAKARAAVNYAIDRRAIVRLFGGLFKAGCYFIPDGHAGPPRRAVPVRRPQRGARPRQGQAARPGVGHRGRAGDGVGQHRDAVGQDRAVLRRRPQLDRLQGEAEADRPRRVPRDGRQPEDARPDRHEQLVRRLPAPGQLHAAVQRLGDHADATTRTTPTSTIPSSTSRSTSSTPTPTSRRPRTSGPSSTSTRSGPTTPTRSPTGRAWPRSSCPSA